MSIQRNISNIIGWRSPRKIVVIESDDWGSIRMSSNKSFQALTNLGIDLTSGDSSRYNHYDSLATADDLSTLFETLASFKGSNGNPSVFTAVSVVANTDFDKIRATGYQEYHYESFTETLQRYPGCQDSFRLWQEGIERKLFIPQFHGREHLNVTGWLKLLQNGNKKALAAFDQRLWAFVASPDDNLTIELQAAFDLESPTELPYQETVIKEGLALFERLFGYKATFFVPPNGPFCSSLEKTAAEHGIRFMSTAKVYREPPASGIRQKSYRWLGKGNSCGQRYITRNCFFEPSSKGRDWVDTCLNEIAVAFRWHKPAIISSHRVNYIGALDVSNRDNGLRQLKSLISRIKHNWPDVEFMSSDKLGELFLT